MSEEAVSLAEIEVSEDQFNDFFDNNGDIELAEVAETTAEPAAETAEPKSEVQPEPEQEREKFVPHGALHEERMRRKELQEQLNAQAERTKKMEETFQKIQERINQEQQVRYEDDPLEHLRQQNQELQQRLQHYDSRFSQQDQQAELYRQQQEFVSKYQQSAQVYAQQQTDFNDAYRFLMSSRQSELQAVGYEPNIAAQIMAQEEAMIVGKAFDDGVNPAERMYALAKTRGYAKAAPEQTPEEVKMQTLEKGLEASRSLSSGNATKGEMTLETLADLDDDEFDKVWSKLVGGDR